MPSSKPSPRDLGLSSDSFAIAHGQINERIILNIMGKQKVGKNHLAFQAPDPIIVFNFDQGLEGVIENAIEQGKIVMVAGVPPTGVTPGKPKYPSYHFARPIPNRGQPLKDEEYLTRVKKAAFPIWERWIADMDQAYKSKAKTMIIDTGTAAFQLGRFAFLGMDKPGKDDDPFNKKGSNLKSIFQGVIANGYNYDKNVIWLNRVKPDWVGGQPTGKDKVAGYDDLPYEVQATLHLSKEGTKHVAEIKDCRLNNGLNYKKFKGTMWSLPIILSEIFRNDVDDWL